MRWKEENGSLDPDHVILDGDREVIVFSNGI
jgi:hypothetical protein